MGKKAFISYRHSERDWVWDRLVPVLEAGGAEVLLDRDRFRAGEPVIGEMDATQDQADTSVLVLSPEYLKSDYCLHEMQRAKGNAVPVKRVTCEIPEVLTDVLRVNLADDSDALEWQKLLKACQADLGCTAPDWLKARAAVLRYLERGQSVNLVAETPVRWEPLIAQVRELLPHRLGEVDLERGRTLTRPDLVGVILEQCGLPAKVPAEPRDLVELDRALSENERSWLAFLHFDYAARRDYYGTDLFSTLRHLMMGSRKLVLLAQSHAPFATLLPRDHPMSAINIQTVELRGR